MDATKRVVILAVKILLPMGIIIWLLTNITPEQWRTLNDRPKNWGLLAAAFVLGMTALCLTFWRWQLLVLALGIRFRLRDAFRLGFLGYLLNFVSAGAVGGDLFKAVFIAREQPGRRTEAIASVIVDRVIGLYALLLLTGFVVLFWPPSNAEAAAVANVALFGVGAGGIAILMMFVPGFTQGAVSRFICRLPKIGGIAERMLLAVRLYRNQPITLVAILAISLFVHLLTSGSIYLTAKGLYSQPPSLTEHLIIVPVAMVAGALPFTPAGLGVIEMAMDKLYRIVPESATSNASGVTVALVYRMITIAMSAIGIAYYWSCRKQVQEVLTSAPAMVRQPEG